MILKGRGASASHLASTMREWGQGGSQGRTHCTAPWGLVAEDAAILGANGATSARTRRQQPQANLCSKLHSDLGEQGSVQEPGRNSLVTICTKARQTQKEDTTIRSLLEPRAGRGNTAQWEACNPHHHVPPPATRLPCAKAQGRPQQATVPRSWALLPTRGSRLELLAPARAAEPWLLYLGRDPAHDSLTPITLSFK